MCPQILRNGHCSRRISHLNDLDTTVFGKELKNTLLQNDNSPMKAILGLLTKRKFSFREQTQIMAT